MLRYPQDNRIYDTIWLALSDAPGAMEFVTHTNTLYAAVEVHKRCNMSHAYGPGAGAQRPEIVGVFVEGEN